MTKKHSLELERTWTQMETEELRAECSKATPSAEKVRDSCRERGVPDALRSRVWQVLLGVTNRKANLEAWWEDEADDSDARQIRCRA